MSNIYQHFRQTEKEFIDSVVDWVRHVGNFYSPYLTPFLDPRQQYILQTVAGQYDDINLSFNGGFEESERKRALIFPSYFEPEDSDFDVSVFEVRYPTKFAELSHASIMGSILSSGLSRDTLGDIVNQGVRWQFATDKKIKDFIDLQVDRIGKTSINLIEVASDDIILPEDDWTEDTEIISSLRLDAFIASTLNVARDKAKTLINSGRVKLNWAEVDKGNIILDTNDVISVRGYGRLKYVSELGRTKKDKYLIQVYKKLH